MVLEIQLVRIKDTEVVVDTSAAATDRGSEGMAVTHSSNVDQLMNRVFRLVVYEVIDKVAAKLAMDPREIQLRIVFVEP